MSFIKEDLIGKNYNWDSQFSFTGSPSRRLFDQTDGNQVLFIINFLESLSATFTIQEGHRVEELIRHQLPTDIKSEMSVFNWLRDFV